MRPTKPRVGRPKLSWIVTTPWRTVADGNDPQRCFPSEFAGVAARLGRGKLAEHELERQSRSTNLRSTTVVTEVTPAAKSEDRSGYRGGSRLHGRSGASRSPRSTA